MASARAAVALVLLAILGVSSASAQTTSSPVVKSQLTGLTWNGSSFIASYGEFTSYLLNVSLDGKTITPFAPSFSGQNETYIALSDGTGGFPKGQLFVSSLHSIYEMSPNGSSFHVFSTPPGVQRIGYLAFDRVGTWGHVLFAVDDNGLLWSIASNGTAKTIENFGAGQKPEGIVVAPQTYGGFGGYLFVSLEYGKALVAMAPNDLSKVIPVLKFPTEAPERILLIPPASDLYVAKFVAGTILRVPAANLTTYAGSLLVITEGDVEANGSMTVLQAAGSNLTQTRIFAETDHPHFEAADFVPQALSSSTTLSTSAPGSPPPQSAGPHYDATTIAVIGVFVIAGGLFAANMLLRRKGH